MRTNGYTVRMRSLYTILKVAINSVFEYVPIAILERIENFSQKQLGKGSGAWSTRDEAREICKFIESKALKEVVAIDVGANVGNWSAQILNLLPKIRVIAFEPSKKAFSELALRFSAIDNFKAFNIALGNIKKKSTLYADESGSGLGSLNERRVEHFNIVFSHKELVEVTTLDEFIEVHLSGLEPNVLKMDVEGYELQVLLGARETLKKIQIVQFEFGGSNIDSRTYFQDFWYFFYDLGFDIYRISPRGPIPILCYSEQDEIFKATNFIAVRK